MNWHHFARQAYNWQSLLAGTLAIVAAGIGAAAAYGVAGRQSRDLKAKERAQGRALATAIYPELLILKVHHERACKVVFKPRDPLWGVRANPGYGMQAIKSAKIEIPPLMDRFSDQLFILNKVGTTLLQILSAAMQYNRLLDTLTKQTLAGPIYFTPESLQAGVGGHLRVLGRVIAEAEELIKPIYGEANPDMDRTSKQLAP